MSDDLDILPIDLDEAYQQLDRAREAHDERGTDANYVHLLECQNRVLRGEINRRDAALRRAGADRFREICDRRRGGRIALEGAQ
ncbi:hypothetical protein [Methylobrevis pamukkalensis]|uniref:Uncharacterized protein n=1 Tax=Methylobrevis pamukkalensis TaxID=1439726 RepID=A0A1E3GYS6_9HYPH|nr:hypothetical protein [Methylobrevis pamukkalensis]ODN69203.1 hypothetical protein A6302_03465 [Methylobrevis pamukkalensis]